MKVLRFIMRITVQGLFIHQHVGCANDLLESLQLLQCRSFFHGSEHSKIFVVKIG